MGFSSVSGSLVIKSFEDLDVYQRAYAVSLEIHRISLTLPKIE
jgi:hypothetical protein